MSGEAQRVRSAFEVLKVACIWRRLVSAAACAFAAAAPATAQAQTWQFLACSSAVQVIQEDGTWVSWGNDGKSFAGLASSYFGNTANNGANMFRPRRQKALEAAFMRPANAAASPVKYSCSADGGTAFAIYADGTAVGWGNGSYGQIGTGNLSDQSAPAGLLASGIVEIVGSRTHTLALLRDGTVAAWGANTAGQLGDGSTADTRPVPGQVQGITGARALAVGRAHSLALLSDGTVKAWGFNGNGELGDGTWTDRLSPVTVSGLTNVVAIAAIDNASLALKSDGTVWAWGYTFYGGTGEGSFFNGATGRYSRQTPVQVNVPAVSKLKASYNGVMVVTRAGKVYGWGYSDYYVVSGSFACFTACLPTLLPLPEDVVDVFMFADSAAFGRTSDGRLYAWGSNFHPQGILGRAAADTYNAGAFYWRGGTLVQQSQGTAPSDFNRDHVSDILFRNASTGDVWLWNISDSRIASSAAVANVPAPWQVVNVADADGDGKADLYWRNSATGENAIWLMDNRALKGTIGLPTVNDPNWLLMSVADLDGDGINDLVWRNAAAGQWAVWLMTSTGVKSARAYGGVPGNWDIRCAADFNGDGKADIIWRESTTGAVAIYRMDGATVNGVSFLAGGLAEWDIAVVQDVDLDGYADIVFRYNTGSALALVKLNAVGTAIASTSFLNAAGGAWRLEAVGDFNGDSFPDYLWRSSAGELALWELSGLVSNSNTTYTAKLLGNPGNAWQVVKQR